MDTTKQDGGESGSPSTTPRTTTKSKGKGKEKRTPAAADDEMTSKRTELPRSSETDPDIDDFKPDSPHPQRRVVASTSNARRVGNKKEGIATSTNKSRCTKDPREDMAGCTPAALLADMDRLIRGDGEWQTTAAATSSTVNQVNVLGSSTVPNTNAGTGAAAGRVDVIDVDGDARWSQLPGEHKRRRKLNLSLRRNRPTGSDGIAVAALGNSVEGRTPSCATAATALALAPDMAVMYDGAPEPRRGSSQSAVRDGAVDDLVATTASAMDTTDV
jgi:hypothetical protein